MSEPIVVTTDDVQELNRTAVVRASAFVRIAGTALVVVGLFGLLAWLWGSIRSQQHAEPPTSLGFRLPGSADAVSLVERLDLFFPYVGIAVSSALVVGVGLLLRLVADFAVERVGGTLSGFEPGDVLPEVDDDP
jgi:hypothetical protein